MNAAVHCSKTMCVLSLFSFPRQQPNSHFFFFCCCGCLVSINSGALVHKVLVPSRRDATQFKCPKRLDSPPPRHSLLSRRPVFEHVFVEGGEASLHPACHLPIAIGPRSGPRAAIQLCAVRKDAPSASGQISTPPPLRRVSLCG